jgi:hypothetical protein
MKWWLSDFLFELALVFAVIGWVAASIGPLPMLISWALAAVALGVAPTRRRVVTLTGIVLFGFYYLGIMILVAALANYVAVSIHAHRRQA